MWVELRGILGPIGTWSGLGVVVGVALGWGLQEISAALRARSEDRKVIGHALGALLDIRFAVLTPGVAIGELRKHGMPAEVEGQARFVFGQLFLRAGELSQQYAAAIDALAASDPVLAFWLRSKDLISFITRLREIVPSEPRAQGWYAKFESDIVELTLPRLNEAIIALAWKHGARTWWRTRSLLNDKIEVPGEVSHMIANHIATAPRVNSEGSAAASPSQ